jgi:hypothetical protein
MPTWNILHS